MKRKSLSILASHGFTDIQGTPVAMTGICLTMSSLQPIRPSLGLGPGKGHFVYNVSLD